MMLSSVYKYEPLPKPINHIENAYIRLLDLRPGKSTDQICCQISTASLDSKVQPQVAYEALSYCWGDSNSSILIECNASKLLIRKSLHTALLALRDERQSRTLWVDAICINQADVGERNQQVSIMRAIYSHATRVLAWLGESADESDRAMSLISSWYENSLPQIKIEQPIPQTKEEQPNPVDSGERRDPRWKSLFTLLERSYFRRVWVIQEVVVSQHCTVICGRQAVPLDQFLAILTEAIDLAIVLGWSAESYEQFSEVRDLRSSYHHNYPVPALSVFLNFRKSLATDPRDKLFALYGVVKDKRFDLSSAQGQVTPLLESHGLVPEYDLTVEEVYIKFATALLRTSENLDLLSVPRLQGTINLPTWVPDWSVDFKPSSWFKHIISEGSSQDPDDQGTKPWRAAGNSKSSARLGDNQRHLSLRGHILDTISRVGPVLLPDDHPSRLPRTPIAPFSTRLHVFESWEMLSRAFSGRRYVTGEHTLNVYWNILTTGNCNKPNEDDLRLEFWEWRQQPPVFRSSMFCSCSEGEGLGRIRNSIASVATHGMHRHELLQSTQQALSNNFCYRIRAAHRRLVKTTMQYLALAPPETRVGDKIAIFEGCKAPLVIRGQGEYWELVGDCYVHGVMHGEAFRQEKCERMTLF